MANLIFNENRNAYLKLIPILRLVAIHPIYYDATIAYSIEFGCISLINCKKIQSKVVYPSLWYMPIENAQF